MPTPASAKLPVGPFRQRDGLPVSAWLDQELA
ncbi:hypothetical protein EV653_3068 [Kribbella pratensis]|uniref:Uncharacterized protein n=1 Tax=Kribbella pratensis TaxID=2512112 RepID=A0A4R8CP40_9ACTN|nr:hypothetical protein EV653_3068 [Kribbella pratensis]